MNRLAVWASLAALSAGSAAAAGEVRFEKPGVFLDARPGNSYLALRLPAAPRQVYDRVTIRYRMRIAAFQPVFNSFIGLTRSGAPGYFAMQIRADKSKTLIDRKDGTQYGEVAPWRAETEYDIRIVYDAGGGTIEFEAFLPGGERLQRLSTTIANRVIEDAGGGLTLDFGLDRVYGQAFYPPLGWRFSNLVVELSAATGVVRTTHTYKTAGTCAIKLDIHRPAAGRPRPVVFWLHGGALIFGHRGNLSADQLRRYVDAGFAVVSVDYRLAPETKLPEIVSDVEDAWRWLQTNGRQVANLDVGRTVVVGHSAGGYLALSAGHRVQPRPRAVVAFYGYGDITASWLGKRGMGQSSPPKVSREQAYASVGTAVISGTDSPHQRFRFYAYVKYEGLWPLEVSGHDPQRDPEWFRPYCPVRNVTPEYPPTMLLHGDQDDDVPMSQSEQMAAELKRQGVQCTIVPVGGAGHGFDGKRYDPAVARLLDQVVAFLRART